jgi:hypothetical protein
MKHDLLPCRFVVLYTTPLLGALMFLPTQSARAESGIASAPTGALTKSARLDFSITVERFLYLRVGAGTAAANNPNVDMVNFAVTGANNGSGSAVAGSTKITAQIRGTGGSVSFTNTTPGSMSNGTHNVSYSSVSATAAPLPNSATVLNHPGFVNGASSASTSLVAVNNVVDAGATWTFSYANTAPLGAGTFGATLINNGRVIYTAVMP